MKFVRVRGGVVFSLVMFVAMTGWAAPKKKVVTVAADGSGDFKDVQSAVDSDPEGNVVIRIKPGIYKQLVNIKANGVELRGLGK